MHDTDGISSHCRVKNSTLLRSRVEFQIKSFCFFHCLLDRGHFRPINYIFIVFSNELTGKTIVRMVSMQVIRFEYRQRRFPKKPL